MAFDVQPKNTSEWNDILQSENYEEAFKKSTKYIGCLQCEVDKYKSLYEKERKRVSGLTVDDILNKNVLDKIRKEERNKVYESEKDWSGLQEGL